MRYKSPTKRLAPNQLSSMHAIIADVDDDIDYAIGRVTWPVKPETKTISAALTIKTRLSIGASDEFVIYEVFLSGRNLTSLKIHLEIKLEFVFGLSSCLRLQQLRRSERNL